jgi:hypothetical protein
MEKILQPLSSPEELKAQAAQAQSPQPAAPTPEAASPQPILTTLSSTPQVIPAAIQADPIVNGQPLAAAPTLQFLTGSSMAEQKTHIPVGIYIIVGLQVVGVVLSFFSAANNNMLFTLLQIVDLLLAVGLLLRLEFVRQTIIFLSALVIVFSALDSMALLAVQSKANKALANYNHAVSQLDKQSLSEQQRSQLAALNAEVQDSKKKEGHAMTIAWLNVGVEVVVSVGTMAYLVRPKVRGVFRQLES